MKRKNETKTQSSSHILLLINHKRTSKNNIVDEVNVMGKYTQQELLEFFEFSLKAPHSITLKLVKEEELDEVMAEYHRIPIRENEENLKDEFHLVMFRADITQRGDDEELEFDKMVIYHEPFTYKEAQDFIPGAASCPSVCNIFEDAYFDSETQSEWVAELEKAGIDFDKGSDYWSEYQRAQDVKSIYDYPSRKVITYFIATPNEIYKLAQVWGHK